MGCGALLLSAAPVIAGVSGYLWLRSAAGQEWLRATAESTLSDVMVEGEARIGGLSTNVWDRVELTEVELREGEQRRVVSVGRIGVRLNPWALLRWAIVVPEVEIEGVIGDLRVDEDGAIDIARMFTPTEPAPPAEEPWSGLPIALELPSIRVGVDELSLIVEDFDVILRELTLSATLNARDTRFELTEIALDGDVVGPAPGPLSLRGDAVWEGQGLPSVDLVLRALDNEIGVEGSAPDLFEDDGEVDLKVVVSRLALSDLDRVLEVPLQGVVTGEILAEGAMRALQVEGRLDGVEDLRAQVRIRGSADPLAPSFGLKAEVIQTHLEDLIVGFTEPIAVGATLHVDGEPEDSWLGLAMRGRLEGHPMEVQGVRIDRVESRIRIQEGVAHLEDLSASGPVGRVLGSVSLDLQSGGLHSSLEARGIDPMALKHFGVPTELAGTRASATLEVRGEVFDPALPARVTAQLRIVPVRWGPEVRVERVTANAVVDHHSGVATGRGSATIGRVDAYGVLLDGAEVAKLRFRVDERGLDLSGALSTQAITYRGLPEVLHPDLGEGAEFESVEGPFIVHAPFTDEGELYVDANLSILEHKLLRFPGTHGEALVRIEGNDLRGDLLLHATPNRRLVDLRAAMALDALRLQFDRLDLHPMPSQRWSMPAGSGLRIAPDGTLDELDLSLRSSRGELGVGGRVLGESEQDLSLSIYDLDLEVVAELLPSLAGGLQGHAGLALNVGGLRHAVELDGELEAYGLAWFEEDEDGAPFPVARDLGGRLILEGRAQRVEARGALRGMGSPLVELDLAVPVHLDLLDLKLQPHEPWHGDFLLIPGRLKRLAAVLPGVVLPEASGSGRLRLAGTPVRPEARWAAAVEVKVDGLEEPLRVETFLGYGDGEVTTDADVLEGFTRRADLRMVGRSGLERVLDWALLGAEEPDLADLDLWLPSLGGGLVLRGMPLDRANQLTGLAVDVEGTLWGKVNVDGSLRKPVPTGELSIEGGRFGRVEVLGAEVVLLHEGEGHQIGIDVLMRDMDSREEGEIYLDGSVPVQLDLHESDPAAWVTGELDLRPRAQLPLALLTAFDPGFRRVSGQIELFGSVRGDPFDPRPEALLTLTEGSSLGYEALGVLFSDLSFAARFDPELVEIERLVARTGPLQPRRDPLGLLGRLGQELGRGFGLFSRRDGERRGLFRRRRSGEGSGSSSRGTLRAGGTASLDSWYVTDMELTATLDRVLLLGTRDEVLRLSTDPDSPLRVTGDALLPKVRGSVRVDEADFFLDYAAAMGGGPSTVDPRIKVNRGDRVVVTPPPEASVFDDIDIEVRINLGRAARGRLSMPIESLGFLGQTATSLTRMDIRARLGGDLVFRQVPCRRRDPELGVVEVAARAGSCGLFHPQAEGAINILEGQARVLRADFDLQDSQVQFFGNEIANPSLDIKGKMVTGDVTIDMTVRGTAFEPDVDFTSADSDQIFATLLLGTSPDALGSQGASQLAFAAAMTAFQSVLSGTNLGTFSIEPSGQIVWGMAVARDLFVEGTIGGTPRPDQNTFEIEVEYMILRNLIGRVGFGAYAIPFWSDLLIERRFD
ncbi:MAG: hypothetical protein EA397_09855 [Deltaproteobacteria bacterium]|nr:MAG: hypothetical protein EA397_09855 [Deltaproteobacteria bacterium]